MRSDSAVSFLAALKAGTRDLHDRTEAAFVLGRPGLSRAAYADVLARMHGFYAGAEAGLARWAPAFTACGLDLARREKAALLARDLRALGAGPTHAAAGTPTPGAPGDPPLPLPTAAHAFGALYVLEGATLGGQLLRRQIGAALGLTPDDGLAFLSGYGPDVGPMWRAFGEALARFECSVPPGERPAVGAAAVAGARATFLAFERWVVAPTACPTAA